MTLARRPHKHEVGEVAIEVIPARVAEHVEDGDAEPVEDVGGSEMGERRACEKVEGQGGQER